MSIHNADAYVSNLWDWACLDGCFGGKIRPSDIDGCVERKGHFLFLETKAPGAEVPTGQSILLQRLARNPMHAVIFIWGTPGRPQKLKLLWQDTEVVEEDANLETLRRWCQSWYRWANGPISELP